MKMVSKNPATGQLIAEYAEIDEAALRSKVNAAASAFERWRRTGFAERSARMKTAARLLRERRDRLATLMTMEMGKLIGESRSEVEKCAWACEYFADNAESMLSPMPLESDGSAAYARLDPLGVILAIMPWNFPFWQVFRFASAALMAGNGALLKHAPNVTGCALAIESLLRDAGFPPGLFAALVIDEKRVENVIADDAVRAVTLTGSVRAGRAVASVSGAYLKKTVLELGGSDAFLVLSDADFESAVETAFHARMLNAGQSCIAAKRFIVVRPLVERFTTSLEARMRELVPGDPSDDDTSLGPLARADLVENLDRQVRASVAAGAVLVCGGARPERVSGKRGALSPDCYYLPTVLSGVVPGMPAFDEETFGPLAAVVAADDEEEAIALANRSAYGLGGAVWTADRRRGERIAASLDTGNVFINGFTKSDPRLPFGGVKASGYGRELSTFGIREFVNVKTVWIA